MEKTKKLISIFLAFCLILGMNVTAFASTPLTQSNEVEYLTIIDEEKGTVQAVRRNTVTGESIYGPLISVNNKTENPYKYGVSTRAKKIHQDTFLNYEYDIWETSPREWNLERPNTVFNQYYFKVYENASNKSELRNWKSDVDALNAQEWAVIGGVGLSVFNSIRLNMDRINFLKEII